MYRCICLVLGFLVWAPSVFAGDVGIFAQRVVGGLSSPIYLTSAPGDNRLFIVEQGGLIRIADGGTLRPEPFLDLTGQVVFGGERGLLGLAFHPEYAANRLLYCNFTERRGLLGTNTVIARFQATLDGQSVDASTRFDLLVYDQPFNNHNGGMLAFGPDDYLYISSGDGGSFNDPLGNGQKLQTLLGKILRIDVNGPAPFGIPPSNPFAGSPDVFNEIWSYGLRNPWRFSFDRETGDMWIGDVGQNAFEEIDFAPTSSLGGENYGWVTAEGFACLGGSGTCGTNEGFTPPIHTYPRSDGQSVTGGYVYRGMGIPELRGLYLFADFVSTRIWSLDRQAKGAPIVIERTSELRAGDAAGAIGVSTFGEDNFGELYFTSYDTGEVFKIRRTVSIADVDGNNETNASDIQIVINEVLSGGNTIGDIDNSLTVNSVDIQLAINGALGII